MNSSGTRATDEVLAWTERDGPGRPPPGPGHRSYAALAVGLGLVLWGMAASDTLCAEHRLWAQSLALFGLLGGVTAVVGLVRGSAFAPLLTVATALAGVGIGILDAAHAPVRGGLVALAFTGVGAFACWLASHDVGLRRWERMVLAEVGGAPEEALPPIEASPPAGADAEEAASFSVPLR